MVMWRISNGSMESRACHKSSSNPVPPQHHFKSSFATPPIIQQTTKLQLTTHHHGHAQPRTNHSIHFFEQWTRPKLLCSLTQTAPFSLVLNLKFKKDTVSSFPFFVMCFWPTSTQPKILLVTPLRREKWNCHGVPLCLCCEVWNCCCVVEVCSRMPLFFGSTQ